MVNIFTKGSCLNFYLILRTVYPNAIPWYNQDHIVTEIDGRFYDITGSVSNEGYLKYSEFYNKKRMIKSFKQMYKHNYKITT